jgi:hypothetical protein
VRLLKEHDFPRTSVSSFPTPPPSIRLLTNTVERTFKVVCNLPILVPSSFAGAVPGTTETLSVGRTEQIDPMSTQSFLQSLDKIRNTVHLR